MERCIIFHRKANWDWRLPHTVKEERAQKWEQRNHGVWWERRSEYKTVEERDTNKKPPAAARAQEPVNSDSSTVTAHPGACCLQPDFSSPCTFNRKSALLEHLGERREAMGMWSEAGQWEGTG